MFSTIYFFVFAKKYLFLNQLRTLLRIFIKVGYGYKNSKKGLLCVTYICILYVSTCLLLLSTVPVCVVYFIEFNHCLIYKGALG